MKVLFIQPTPYYDGRKLVKKKKLYFVGLAPAILASLAPEDVEFEVCLETIEDVDFDTNADLIALSGMGHAIIRSIDIADRFMAIGKTVVMGGYMASLMPHEAKEHCHSVVIGDGEASFPKMLEDFKNGCLQPFYEDPLEDFSIPLPKYELLAKKNIGDFLPVQAGRGCPNTCSFCSVYCLYKGKYLKREIDEVIRDIRRIKELGYKKFLLLDDNIYSDVPYLKALCLEISKLGMKWLSQCSISIADDPQLLELVAKSGCIALSFGLESISQESLSKMGKGWANASAYSSQLKKVVLAGIDVSTEMVVGADGDTLESIRATSGFVTEQKIVVPRFYIITPIPGTVFFREMSEAGRIVNSDIYSYNGAQAVHQPAKMSPQDLTDAYWALYKDVFTIKSILKRSVLRKEFWAKPLKYLFYLYVNLYYRCQIYQGITPNII
ncbi:MAG: B12-binding domain-containing radical SAM protein [Eubacteriaceae bacterium]|nr:B12-binding domain-containing radical SAM protein [Eubacteriaceae bacterium]